MARLARSSCPLILALACFAPVLFADRQFAFRDAGDFYYPLHLRVQQEWRAGRLPLWEPEENGGVPLLGNPATAVLYPGTLIYAAFPYPWAARIYIITHVALAFAAMSILMRGWGVSPTGSVFAALAYAFGGPVLLQYCNVIFLVGAAWMPFAFYFADRWLDIGDRRALAWLGLVLSMQTLGGDPKAAYLSAFAAAICALGVTLAAAGQRRSHRLVTVILTVVIACDPDMTTTVHGPLETAGALRDAWRGFGQGAVVSAAVLVVARRAQRAPALSCCLALAVSALDLGLAHAPLVYTVPQRILDFEPRALSKITQTEARDPSPGPFRIHRPANWAPIVWLYQGSAQRLPEIARWERDSLRPKYAIAGGLSYTYTRGTAELSDLVPFFDTLRVQLDA
jgi:hypothetical protein